MSDYWHPTYKWQLVAWFKWRYPLYPDWKWERMSKRQLYGKYKEVRDGSSEYRKETNREDTILQHNAR